MLLKLMHRLQPPHPPYPKEGDSLTFFDAKKEAKKHPPLQGLLNVVDSCHDSAKQASLMALTAPRVQRGMQPLRLSLLH